MNEPLLREKHRVPQHFQPLCDARRALLLRNLLQLRGIRRDLLTAHEVLSAKLSQLEAAQPVPRQNLISSSLFVFEKCSSRTQSLRLR